MSSYIFNIKISEILGRVGERIGTKKNESIAKALGVEPQTASNWKSRGAIPWKELFIFSQENGISFDWLLTGKEPSTDFMSGWSQEVKTACGLVKEIIESGDKIIVPALLTSLPAMRAAVEGNRGLEEKKMYERRIKELERDVRRLRKLLEPGFGGAAGEEGGSASKKKKTSSM